MSMIVYNILYHTPMWIAHVISTSEHMQTIKNIFTAIVDTVFPKECVGCRTTGTFLCDDCLGSVHPAPPCEHAFIRAVFDYRNPVIKRATWRLKYENARPIARPFAPYLYDEILGAISDNLSLSVSEKFLLVPIPLHTSRLRERGYNQSELLARELLKLDSAGLFELAPDLLVRSRATKPQARNEKRAVRIDNLRDAFVCPAPERIRGRIVILIDDVTTTGATLLEAKRALAVGKPRKVFAFTVGH